MEEHLKFNSLEGIIEQMQCFLSKNRGSLTPQDIALLSACLEQLRKAESSQDYQELMKNTSEAVSLLLKFFAILDGVKDLF